MGYPFLLEVIDGTENLGHDVGHVPLSEMLASSHRLKQLSSIAVFCNDVENIPVLYHIIKLNDVGMIDLPQDFQFGEEGLLSSSLSQPSLLYYLDGPFLLGNFVVAFVDESKPSLPYLLIVNVLFVYVFMAYSDEKLSIDLIALRLVSVRSL